MWCKTWPGFAVAQVGIEPVVDDPIALFAMFGEVMVCEDRPEWAGSNR